MLGLKCQPMQIQFQGPGGEVVRLSEHAVAQTIQRTADPKLLYAHAEAWLCRELRARLPGAREATWMGLPRRLVPLSYPGGVELVAVLSPEQDRWVVRTVLTAYMAEAGFRTGSLRGTGQKPAEVVAPPPKLAMPCNPGAGARWLIRAVGPNGQNVAYSGSVEKIVARREALQRAGFHSIEVKEQ